ncbi:MAG: NUDIX domain-containing protein [Chloroflexi bacterium]|nr:NUDIX domain-containing protein [Chloroflexota bacterium]
MLKKINSKFVVGVSGIISDDAGRMLLVQPRYWPDKAWGLPGGMVKRGESFEEALARELLEETGLIVDDIRLLHVRSGFALRLEVYYTARIAGGTYQLDPVEILDAGFFTFDTLPATLLSTHHETLRRYMAEKSEEK